MNDTRSRLERIQSYAKLHRIVAPQELDPHGNQWPERRSSVEACAEVDAPRIEKPSDWGHITECTGYDDLPAEDDPRMPKPDWWFVALLAVAAFSAVAACFVIAGAAPLI